MRLAAANRASTAAPADPGARSLHDLPATGDPDEEALDGEIEALAAQARARDIQREAHAIALEWPESDRSSRHGPRTWAGWAALGGAIALAIGAAAAALLFAADEPARSAGPAGLKLDHHLGSAPAKR